MANITRNFIKGKMNKSVDERLIPNGEYIDAINVRMGSTENSEIGVIENTKGNLSLTAIQYKGTPLSTDARCIGAYEDGANETIYWFIHDSNYPVSIEAPLGIIDLIVSYNTLTNQIVYHVISVNKNDVITTLNFNPDYLITGVDLVEDLLFFTDNINPPRFINVKRNYPDPALFTVILSKAYDYNVQPQILEEELQVIKKPPLFSPSVDLLETSSEETFLEDRFICFAYRYRYADNDYSATSPFSQPAFSPESFRYSVDTSLNEGMTNKFNTASVTVNTGGPLVLGVDLLFKDAEDSTIKVIEKLDKAELGLADDSDYNFTFDNSNIFTILPDSEILRLYDNVPRTALAQTMMGNRLIYGNYVDGYNLIRGLNPTKIEYFVDLISENNQITEIEETISDTQYPLGLTDVDDGLVTFDFSTIPDSELIKGATITFDFSLIHSKFFPAYPQTSPPILSANQETPVFDLNHVFTLPRDYNNIYELADSDEFRSSIGIGGLAPNRNIKPMYDPADSTISCSGTTLTDFFNCKIPIQKATTNPGTPVFKTSSGTGRDDITGSISNVQLDSNGGVSDNNQAVDIGASTTSKTISFRFPYVKYTLDPANNPDTGKVYEFYYILSAAASFELLGDVKSLHSNRNYEVGIVYMDEFGRSSTGLVSDNNTVSIPCSKSASKNYIKATIPTTQIAPEWATHYKFIIKPDEAGYNSIFTNIYFVGDNDGMIYFLLDGENSLKVEKGDRLIVKRDGIGVSQSCVYTTVLDKEAYASDEITDGNPAGPYMKISPNSINVGQDADAVIDTGLQTHVEKTSGNCAILDRNRLTMGLNSSPFVPFDVPQGSRVEMFFSFNRNGTASLFGCERRTYEVSIEITATRDYPNMLQFLNGENFQSYLDDPDVRIVDDGQTFVTEWLGDQTTASPTPSCELGKNIIYWVDGDAASSLKPALICKGPQSCGGNERRKATIQGRVRVVRADNAVLFESEPQDSLPNVWYESADTYEIYEYFDVGTGTRYPGLHRGGSGTGEQDQTDAQPAIINTDFFNCYAFGNGAESYRVRDSIVGKTFDLGNRVLTTSEKEFKEADRFADLTYSGIYNQENNINKLNEFNLGLLNFKPLEQSFGTIQKLFGRETDILTLQEDRISYVLQGKEMITGSTGGSSLITVPEILGKQVARVEEYGISNNPESFVQWGMDKYFTDAKRGAVIQLKGSAAQNEKLTVISEQGMRSWFRDLFIESFETQKLGGFDPYMDEYVLSSNDILKPSEIECDPCGVGKTFKVTEEEATTYCVDVGEFVGDIDIEYQVIQDSAILPGFSINANYNGVDYFSGNVTTGGTLTFPKQSVSEQFVYITVLSNDTTTLQVLVNCPDAEEITIINVCFTGDDESGLFIHNEYRWTDGSFTSPLHSESVEFQTGTNNPLVSQYQEVSGRQGGGIIPSDTATVRLICNKFGFDDFVFDETSDRFKYLRSDTKYDNTNVDMVALLTEIDNPLNPDGGVAAPIINTGAPDAYYAEFNMPASGSYLYLVWDYRTITETTDLCYGATESNACCLC